MLGSNLYRSRCVPGGGSVPAAVVFGCIFKVAVLDEFGVEATVGGITDILEEDADELVADGFLL